MAPPSSEESATLSAFLDTLLPSEELSGSATDLGVDRQIWAFSNTTPDFRKLLDYGCRWLNMTGGARFSALASDQQIAIVDWMSRADWNEIPRRFYELVRQVAVELYYSNPAALGGLSIKPSPQPLGYPPPWS
ncbi:MAG: gluconate 2-dehydrogenase subunit 3 family protein [Azonexaceae bacterium]|nr:gluconate 2-dehydrogenase subunit 3 family protein [Azonexaceae bacterium]